jgi:hypothetical protein
MTDYILWAAGSKGFVLFTAAFAVGVAAVSFIAGYFFCRFRRKEKAEDDFRWRFMAVTKRVRSAKDDFVQAAPDLNSLTNAESAVPEMWRRAVAEISAAEHSLEFFGLPGVGPPEADRFLDQASFLCGRASGWIAAASFVKPTIDALTDSTGRRKPGPKAAMVSWPMSRKRFNKPN